MVNYDPHFDFRKAIENPSAPIVVPCMDQICGWVDIDGHYNSIRKWKSKFDIDYIQGNKAFCRGKVIKSPIAVVLESPHINEFDDNGIAKGPAQGRTGDYFDEHFEKLLKNSSISNVVGTTPYTVVFVNSVQYQCSLGKKPLKGKNRSNCDRNWRLCFDKGCNVDLIKRLNALDPIAVINLCTTTLRSDVDKHICHFNNYTSGYHPASWWRSKYRTIK